MKKNLISKNIILSLFAVFVVIIISAFVCGVQGSSPCLTYGGRPIEGYVDAGPAPAPDGVTPNGFAYITNSDGSRSVWSQGHLWNETSEHAAQCQANVGKSWAANKDKILKDWNTKHDNTISVNPLSPTQSSVDYGSLGLIFVCVCVLVVIAGVVILI